MRKLRWRIVLALLPDNCQSQDLNPCWCKTFYHCIVRWLPPVELDCQKNNKIKRNTVPVVTKSELIHRIYSQLVAGQTSLFLCREQVHGTITLPVSDTHTPHVPTVCLFIYISLCLYVCMCRYVCIVCIYVYTHTHTYVLYLGVGWVYSAWANTLKVFPKCGVRITLSPTVHMGSSHFIWHRHWCFSPFSF